MISRQEKRGTTSFFRESRAGLNHKTKRRMTMKPEIFFWSISLNCVYRHHIERRVKLCVVSVSDENHRVLTVRRLVRLALLHS